MGKVSIESFQGNLRLRWYHERQRYCLTTGLKDTPTNRAIAQGKCDTIAKDIEYGMFDPTLRKYRGEKYGRKPIKVYELFEGYLDSKKGQVAPQTLQKHSGLLNSLKDYFKERYAGAVTSEACNGFRQYLAARLAPVTLKQQLTEVKSAWNWGVKRKYLDENPWGDVVRRVPKGKVNKPQPFTMEEIRAIIQGFRTHPEYSYYADYVEFMLSTGCRIEEAIALTWDDVNEDCSQIWFGKAYSSDDEQPLKAGKAGFVPLSDSLQKMLLKRRPIKVDPSALIFPSRRAGKHMSDRSVRIRAWKTVLEEAGIPYRKPNTARHTLISYWLSQGEDPLTVAKMTRTSLKMIYEHYGNYIPNNTKLPAILDAAFASPDGSGSGV